MANLRTALLLSGGMDSIAIAFWKRPELAITIDYGQRAALAEIRAAEAVADDIGIELQIIRADLGHLGSGDMAGNQAANVAPVPEWWPFRNQMLITLAAMKAIPLGVERLLIGTLKTDRQHADGTPAFVHGMNEVLRMQEGAITIEAPAIELSASELVRTSGVSMDILAWAHSCHVGEHACGMCRGCRKHYETMAELGVGPY